MSKANKSLKGVATKIDIPKKDSLLKKTVFFF